MASRTLEETDIVFTKGYCEDVSYVCAAKELPFLYDEDTETEGLEHGLIDEINSDKAAQKPVPMLQEIKRLAKKR
ncbi:hypothetical protein MMC25_000540 [Agyrium rufum]|nr:hypothetical protein [Agyrium rufum]